LGVVGTAGLLSSTPSLCEDLDSDGIPENSGAPDQTLTIGDYKVSVPTVAGCGWRLEAAIVGQTLMSYPSDHPLGEILDSPLNKPPIQETIAHQTWLEQSRPVYQENSGTVNTTDLMRVVQM